MKWIAKVAAQHALGWTPGAGHIEELMRRRVTRTTAMDAALFKFRMRWGPMPYLRGALEHFGAERLPEIFHYDVGAGWQPIVPFLLRRAGVAQQRLMDIEPHLKLSGCIQVADAFAANEDWVRESLAGIELGPLGFDAGAASLDDALSAMGIDYSVPEDATAIPLAARSVDFVTCTGVLAYLPRQTVRQMLNEFRRIVTPDGLIGIYVHLVDDFATFDPTLPTFHFLRYEDWVWERVICSKRFYNNRLRMDDYRRIFDEHGFTVVDLEEEPPTAADLGALARLPLARRWSDEPHERLGVRRFWAVLRP
jgi:SAM-dependent methyltransferase